jgi:hypothetical protein
VKSNKDLEVEGMSHTADSLETLPSHKRVSFTIDQNTYNLRPPPNGRSDRRVIHMTMMPATIEKIGLPPLVPNFSPQNATNLAL